MEWVGLEWALKTICFQPHPQGQWPLPLDQVAQSPSQPGLLLPDLVVLFLALVILAEFVHSTPHDWSRDRLNNRKSDRVLRAYGVVLQKSEKIIFSQIKGEAGTWFLTADLFPGVLSTICRVFCRERYSLILCIAPLSTKGLIAISSW